MRKSNETKANELAAQRGITINTDHNDHRMPTRPWRAMSALDTLRVTLNSVPRHSMGGKRARALNSIGLGCTAEPRRARTMPSTAPRRV